MRAAYLAGGVALGAGVALLLIRRSREQAEPVRATAPPSEEGGWSSSERLATAAVGAGLVFYGLRGEGKLARAASLAGMGLLARSVHNEPVRQLSDIVSAKALMAV